MKQGPSIKETIKQMQGMMERMLAPKSSFSIDSIFPNPFKKIADMKDFPRKVEIPQYDKYDGNGDPRDHVCQLYIYHEF